MSIATLKKKTAAKYNNNSVGEQVFSINGTHRNQGYVGQTSLSRFTSRTLVRNGGLRNHGGCCGTFNIGTPVLSGITTTEDSNVVKNSVLNTGGMIQTKYRWVKRPQPYSVVKNDNNRHINAQSDYIVIIRNDAVSDAASCYQAPVCNSTSKCNNNLYNTKPESAYTGPGTVPLFKGVALSQSEYALLKHLKCSLQDEYIIANNTNGQPFSGST
jgi:hypothetical protein